MTHDNHILIAEVVAAQGIRGQMKVTAYTEDPEDIVSYGALLDEEGKPVSLKLHSTKNRQAIISIPFITSRNAAEALVGAKFYILKDALPQAGEGEIYYADLVGLEVRNTIKRIGVIKAMHDFGGGDIIEIMFKSGKTEMVLYKQVVKKVDMAEGYVLVEMPDSITVQA